MLLSSCVFQVFLQLFHRFCWCRVGYSSDFRVALFSCISVLRALRAMASFVNGVDEMVWVVVISEYLVQVTEFAFFCLGSLCRGRLESALSIEH